MGVATIKAPIELCADAGLVMVVYGDCVDAETWGPKMTASLSALAFAVYPEEVGVVYMPVELLLL